MNVIPSEIGRAAGGTGLRAGSSRSDAGGIGASGIGAGRIADGLPPLPPDPANPDPANPGPANPGATNPGAMRLERPALWAALTAYVPNRRALEKSRIAAFETGPDAIPFDMMRTRLLQQMRSAGWRRVAITSPSSACGKTMTCLNLAFSLARQPDLFTMLVELDLRRPSMGRCLGLKGRAGRARASGQSAGGPGTGSEGAGGQNNGGQFLRALEGTDPPEVHLLRHGANLAFAPSRTPARNPAELLQGMQAAGVLDALEARYAPDVMIFDMPPMLMTDDMMAFIDQVDCTLLVAAAGVTTAEDLRRCQAELAGRTNVLGVVLNKCGYRDRSERYGYYY